MCVKLFKSYLSSRFQYIHLKGVQSKKKEKGCRVPRGAILRPLVFLIYINDLHNVCFSSKVFLLSNYTSIIGPQCSDIELAQDVARLLK